MRSDILDKAIDLVPLMVVMGSWGVRHTLPSTELSIRAQILEDGGPELWSDFMAELRHLHLGAPQPEEPVLGKMQSAYDAAMAATRSGASTLMFASCDNADSIS